MVQGIQRPAASIIALHRGLCLSPERYVQAQGIAERLLAAGSAGILDRNVSQRGGTCLACLRPALVGNVRKDARRRFTWDDQAEPRIELEASDRGRAVADTRGTWRSSCCGTGSATGGGL